MPLTEYVLPLTGTAAMLSACWAMGKWDFSVGWIVVFVGLSFYKSKLWKQREKRLLALRATATREKEVVMHHLAEDMPAWVQFPDTERVEWINKVILQLWPYIGEYTKQFIKEQIEPQVKASMPGPFKSFRFEHMDMGDIPLRVGGIKVYTENVGRDRVIMDMDVAYAGDCDFVVSVGAFKAGLNNMQFKGKLRAILTPLLPFPPMVGGVSAYFLENPEMDFNLTGMGEMVELPGLMSTVRSVVDAQVAAICVLPNQIVVPLVADIDTARLHFQEPDVCPVGVVRIHVVEARNLENLDMSFMLKKGKSDPYCHVTVGSQAFKTRVIDNNLNPVWKEFFEAVVDQATGQKLRVELFDEDPGCNDEELGRVNLDLDVVRQHGLVDKWYTLEAAKHGELHLQLQWMNLTMDARDLQQQQWEGEWAQAASSLHPAVLMVYIDCVNDLPYPKAKLEPSPFIRVKLGNEQRQTLPRIKTVNPLFQQKFLFFVKSPENQELLVEAIDEGTKRPLGDVTIALKSLLNEPKLELYQQTFQLSMGTHQAQVVMTLRLRVGVAAAAVASPVATPVDEAPQILAFDE